jgi:raffinose/stachyose/melibiose transport system permease protein/N-acetylglucosamine transport system permease protein
MVKRIALRIKADRGMLNRRTGGQRVVFTFSFILFAIYALTLFLPLLWMVLSTFQDPVGFMLNQTLRRPFAFDAKWTFNNYAEVFNQLNTEDGTNFFGMVFNSLWMTITGCVISLFFTTAVAYCMSRYKFPGRDILYTLIIFSMVIPIIGNLGAQFNLITTLGLYDSPLLQVVSSITGFGGMTFLILYGFFKNISWSYAEVVFIDGGNDFTVYFKIMLPQAMPMLGMLFVMGFIGQWGATENIILFFPSYPTLASGMFLIAPSLLRDGRAPIYYAGLLISLIPIITLFMFFAGKIMRNISVGGLKG